MRRTFNLLERLFGSGTVAPIRLLARDSFSLLIKRLARIRTTAAHMLHGNLEPPMPLRLQVETIDICNLKCRMCSRELLEGMNTRTMPLPEFTNMVREVQPFYVTMNGLGEPLLDKTIFEKLAYLRQNGIMSSMPSNGSYLDGERRERLARDMPDVLQMSIDGATRESFEYIRAGGDFKQIVENYRVMVRMQSEGKVRAGAKIRVLSALQKRNLGEYRQMYALMKSMPGPIPLELVPVFDYDEAGGTFRDLIPTREDVATTHAELDAAIAAASNEEEKQFYRRWKGVSSSWISESTAPDLAHPSQHACIVPWYNAYVDAKGRVYPCCYLLSADSQVMGNVRDSSFEQIWFGEKYKQFRARIMNDRPSLEGCATCPRNDDSRIAMLKRLRPLLGGKRAPARPRVLSTQPTSPVMPRRTVWLQATEAPQEPKP